MAAMDDYKEQNNYNADRQEANATGAEQNEQGRASFTTGSTTGGGSNYGQGSHHLGGESYKQGSVSNAGANYDNEAGLIGASSTGTSNEGSASGAAGAAQSGSSGDQQSTVNAAHNATGQERAIHTDTDITNGSRRTTRDSWSNSSDGSNS